MLWSESWNISTRLRPRSFAALQRFPRWPGHARAGCPSGRSAPRPRRPTLRRRLGRRGARCLPRLLESARQSPRAASMLELGISAASRSPEMRADNAPGGRVLAMRSATLTMTSSPTCMPNVSLMTCSRSMSRYKMICAPAGGGAASTLPRVTLECLAGHEAGAGVVLRLDDVGRTLCQHFGDSRCCKSKSCALGGLNSASTPMTRSEWCRIGHANIL